MIKTLTLHDYVIGDRTMTMNVYSIAEDSPHFNHTPLAALSERTKQQLARMLNGKKVLPSEEGYERDWRGLAALAKQKNFCNETAITTDNPIEKVLQFWIKNNPEKAKVGFLQQYLGTIDRWDVCDDLHENFERDTDAYIAKQRRKEFQQNSTQVQNGTEHLRSEGRCITDWDVDCTLRGEALPTYDAYVLYAECDRDKAVEIMKQLENYYGFTLYIKDRDLLAGIRFQHVELIRLIEDRCKHLIVVMTDDFLSSPENNFLFNYTQALQIESNIRKIIPIIYKTNMAIPKTLKIYTLLKYHDNLLFNFWEKLAKSLREQEPLSIDIQTHEVQTREIHTPTAPSELDVTIIEEDEDATEKEEKIVEKIERGKENMQKKLEHETKTEQDNRTITRYYSEGQLNKFKSHDNNLTESSSNVSCNFNDGKKSRTWGRKILGKVFRKKKRLTEPEPS